MNLLQLARAGRSASTQRYSLDQYIADVAAFAFAGNTYEAVNQSYNPTKPSGERTEAPFPHWVGAAYKANGVVFACQVARLRLFSQARFVFKPWGAQPGEHFGTPALRILEKPWPNGSSSELLARMIQDVDLAGNAYVRRTGPMADAPRLERLRPDWVTILLGSNSDLLSAEVIGYLYEEGGPGNGNGVILARDEVAHWTPIPDPIAAYRGMSWLTPILRDVAGDRAFTDHKTAFMDNAATPNMIVKFDASVALASLERFKELFNAEHQGAINAYKTLFLGGGADATVVGSSFKDMDYKAVQGAGETRIASVAGVPPIVVGLSEGLAAATYSNYGQAMRAFGHNIHPLWGGACEALETIIEVPAGSQLWFDTGHVPALQQDEKDAAEIQSVRAQTIRQLIETGFTKQSAITAVEADDFRLLEDTGYVSVQLQTPGAQEPSPPAASPAPSSNGKAPAEEVTV